jgi:hypothetical protein
MTRLETRRRCLAVLLLGAAICGGCGEGSGEYSGTLPSPDGQLFVQEVYPMLLRNCAFVTCHGAPGRFLQVFGPGRSRLDSTATKPDDAATLAEVMHGYERARSMLATAKRVEDCLLLGKPLEPAAGGQGHKGVDELGRNVFASDSDPDYALLFRWARSHGAPPTAGQLAAANAAVAPDAEAGP